MRYEQYALMYKDYRDKEKMICTFWLDHNGNHDGDRMSAREESVLLEAIAQDRHIYADKTGNYQDD